MAGPISAAGSAQLRPLEVVGKEPTSTASSTSAYRSQGPVVSPIDAGPVVLVIEDDPRVLKLITVILLSAGIDVEHAIDGAQGLSMAWRRTYSAIVLDDRLPVLAGLEVLRHLRTSGNGVPTIVITGFPSRPRELEVRSYVSTDYMVKPLRRDSFLEVVLLAISSSLIGSPHAGAALVNDDRTAGSDPVVATLVVLNRAIDGGGDAEQLTSRSALMGQLGRVLADGDVPLHVFVAACRAFRSMEHSLNSRAARKNIEMAKRLIQTAVGQDMSDAEPDLLRVVQAADVHSRRSPLRTKASFARALGVPTQTAIAMLRRSLALDLPALRLVLRVRPVLEDLARSDEHVDQIAYAHGYTDKSHAVHDLDRLLRITPSRFRALVVDHA